MSRHLPPPVWCWDHYKWMGRLSDEALCQREIQTSFTLAWKTLSEGFFKFTHGLRGIYQTLQQEGFCLLSFLAMFGNKWQKHLSRQYTLSANMPFPLTERDIGLIQWCHLKKILLLVTSVLIIVIPEMLSKWWKNKIWYPLYNTRWLKMKKIATLTDNSEATNLK